MPFDLNLSEDQRQILASAEAMLETHYPVSRRRRRQQDDLGELATFGALGLTFPDAAAEEGGYTVVEEALLHVLFGRHLVSVGTLAVAIAARLSARAGLGDLANGLVANQTVICAAVPARETILLVERGGADHALLFAERELVLIDISGAASETVEALGQGMPLQRISNSDVREVARSAEPNLLDIADLLVSAQLLGVAEASRDLAVDYAKVRRQFGQPIGGFQAIKHHCANMAMAAEMVSAQLDMAAIAVRDGRADASYQVAALRHLAHEAAFSNTRTAIQVHGGIGFSAEADIHHYLKQAHLLSRLGQGADLLGMAAPLATDQRIFEGG